MKHPYYNTMTAAAVLAALISTSLAWSSARRARETEQENIRLLRQLAQRQVAEEAFLPEIDAENDPAPVAGELVMLQELMDEPVTTVEDEPKLSYAERLEQMRIADPGQYEAYIAKTEKRQQKLKYYLAERTALFVDLDTSLMTDKELELHETLVDRMSDIWDLVGRLRPPSESDNRELLQEMSLRMRRIEPLIRKERNTLLKLMAHELGYDRTGTKEFTDRVNAIYEYTTLNDARIKKK